MAARWRSSSNRHTQPLLRASRRPLAGADDAKFTEGHLLPVKVAKKVPEAMIGRALSGQEATALLKKLK
jgi:hypothetical protein